MTTIKPTKYTHRFLARLVIEAKTSLAVGSGEKDIITDALVATDVNGLPYIPGTAIAGVVKSMLKQDGVDTDAFFGFQSKDQGEGSQIIFTEAKILNAKGEVVDGLHVEAIQTDSLLKKYAELPARQHARINEKGITVKGGKFDEQVVYAGTRFCFEMEMVSDGMNGGAFEQVLEQLQSQTFRIGSGTRCGFGEIEVIELSTVKLDLKTDLQCYLDKSSNLQESSKWSRWEKSTLGNILKRDDWVKYELTLQPEDFFLFGSGFGDDEADMTPVKGKKVVWTDGIGELIDNFVLIPATSVKGTLSHRVAFYYNKLKGFYVREKDGKFVRDEEAECGNNNKAVQDLFGYENQDEKIQQRGNLIFSDIIEQKNTEEKILNHVSIDRFTGGAIEGALFTEKVTYAKQQTFTMTILAKKDALEGDKVKEAFESALKDICMGMLPLGGGVNRGNGVFKGSVTKNGEPLQ